MTELIDQVKKHRDQFFMDTLNKLESDKHRKNLYLIYKIFNAITLWGTIAVSILLGSSTVLKLISVLS